MSNTLSAELLAENFSNSDILDYSTTFLAGMFEIQRFQTEYRGSNQIKRKVECLTSKIIKYIARLLLAVILEISRQIKTFLFALIILNL